MNEYLNFILKKIPFYDFFFDFSCGILLSHHKGPFAGVFSEECFFVFTLVQRH